MKRTPWEITREMFLSAEEVDGLLRHVRERAEEDSSPLGSARIDRLIIEAMLFSGLRNSEFCQLRVRDTRVGSGESAFAVAGLRGEGRTVYVPEAISALVEQFVRQDRPLLLPEGVESGDLDQPLVFGERRRPFERTGLYRRVVRILTEAGLENRASVQLLRHTYGYLAYLRSGGNLLFVQRQLGHAHAMITSIYAQFVDESYAHLADRVGASAGPLPVEPVARPQFTDEFRAEFD